MEIRRGKLALIGKRGQILDGLRRERLVVGGGCGDGIFGEWLSGGVGDIEVIEATRNALIQSYDRQIEQWSALIVPLIQDRDGTHDQVWFGWRVSSIFVRLASVWRKSDLAPEDGLKGDKGGGRGGETKREI